MQIGLLIESLDQLDNVADWGFDYAEITPGALGPDAEDAEAEAAARARVEHARVPSRTMCGFLPDPERLELMVVGPRVNRERLRSYTTRVFDRMQRARVELMVFGSGTARSVPDGFALEQAQTQLRDFLLMCADLAEPRGLQVVIEPQNYTDTNLLHTVPQAVRLADVVNRPNVQVMADFFHMCLNDEPMQDLVDYARYMRHAHIADPGRGRPITTVDDHARFFEALHRGGYDGCVSQTGPLPTYASPEEAADTLKSLARAEARA
jgi:sugar phosphate isomerase/epimerase